ncbi:MAG: ABC transporter permease [bacterium]|nr:ABC transporter permease [bacterium]
MNKIMAIAMREYLERVRKKSFIIGIILVPLFMYAVFFLPLWLTGVEDETRSLVLVVDESGQFKSEFEASIQDTINTGEPRFIFLDRDTTGESIDIGRLTETEYLDLLLEDELLDWYILIPADVVANPDVEFHGRVVSNMMMLESMERKLTELVRRERMSQKNLDPELLAFVSPSVDLRTIQHKDGEVREAGFETLYMGTMVLVMILYMTILVFGSMINRSILEDKNQHITEVVLSSMKPTQFFTGKILGIGGVGLTQYMAWLLLAGGAVAFGAISNDHLSDMGSMPALQPLTLVCFVLFYVLGFLFYGGLFAAAGSMSTTDQEAQQLMQPIIMMLIVPLVIMIYIFQNPDSMISVVLSMLPMFSPLTMFMRINITSVPVWQLLLSIGILTASVAVTFVIAGRIFRIGILMTGKRASIVEAWRWVRASK